MYISKPCTNDMANRKLQKIAIPPTVGISVLCIFRLQAVSTRPTRCACCDSNMIRDEVDNNANRKPTMIDILSNPTVWFDIQSLDESVYRPIRSKNIASSIDTTFSIPCCYIAAHINRSCMIGTSCFFLLFLIHYLDIHLNLLACHTAIS